MDRKYKSVLYPEYKAFLAICLFFVVTAFVFDTPMEILHGLERIILSRSLLLTDYMRVGGIGASLVNSAIVSVFAVSLLYWIGAKPNGSIIMALWLTAGFGFFGKNVFNMIPLMCGVWLYSRIQKHHFIDYILPALLCATLSPVVSEIAFLNPLMISAGLEWHTALNIAMGILAGLVCGFIFPMLSSITVRVHDGYNLYNMGFAGGIIAMFVVSGLKSIGVVIPQEMLWHVGNNLELAVFLSIVCVALIIMGLYSGRAKGTDHRENLRYIFAHSGRLVSDYYLLCGESAYINMGILGIVGIVVVLVLGADLNGPTIAGIFTMIGFGSFGKHIKNVWPLLVGTVICAHVNTLDVTAPTNILAILFSTGLAPIAGQYGWAWGIVAGFLHVNTVIHAGYLSNGLNLYNNGFAAGFVVLFLLPIITAIRNLKAAER